jgi:hypothetical protein
MKIKAMLLTAAFLAGIALPLAAWAADSAPIIPAGTLLRVRLRDTLTSKTSKNGDQFTGVIDEAVSANGKEVIPAGTIVNGHVAFVKPPGRVTGRAEMRVVLDGLTTPDDVKYQLSGSLEDARGTPCAKTGSDDEGTIKGCGKSKKDAAKGAGIAAAVGASAGATVGMGSEIDCRYFGNCGGPGIGTSTLYGAGMGAAAALVYTLFKKEKDVVLVTGTNLTFVVNRSVEASKPAAAPATASSNSTPNN